MPEWTNRRSIGTSTHRKLDAAKQSLVMYQNIDFCDPCAAKQTHHVGCYDGNFVCLSVQLSVQIVGCAKMIRDSPLVTIMS